MGTLVERTTPYVALVKLPDDKAATAAEGFAGTLNRFDAAMRLSQFQSRTYDQRVEMARHEYLSERAGLNIYFATPPQPVRCLKIVEGRFIILSVAKDLIFQRLGRHKYI